MKEKSGQAINLFITNYFLPFKRFKLAFGIKFNQMKVSFIVITMLKLHISVLCFK